MRSRYKKGSMEEENVKKLEKAGMVWDAQEYRWELYYKAAEEYKRQFGDLEIPCSYVTEGGKKLGVWLNNQKSSYRKKCRNASDFDRESAVMGFYRDFVEFQQQDRQAEEKGHGLTKEQIQKLEALGICWEGKSESSFERKYQIAMEYFKEHGNLEMPSVFIYKGVNLGKWLNELRLARKNSGLKNQTLTKEKVQKLNQIGMVWEKKDSWEYRC
ncbi:MAG TPA: hypothetical protein DDY31_11035, partial [Lachnospiraceae bacterium]|nr:hypothetical protein [Lachnospiraceae bacterium]